MIKCSHRLFSSLFFLDETEEKTFNLYIKSKGVYLHKQIYTILLERNADFISYKELSGVIMYDKGIRNQLFKLVAAVEERYRSILFDTYELLPNTKNPFTDKIYFDDLYKRLDDSESVLYYYSFSRHFSLSELKKFLISAELVTENEASDLSGTISLRNKIMHHNILVTSFNTTLELAERNVFSLEEEIEAAFRLLPQEMIGPFSYDINKCNHITNNSDSRNIEVLCLREIKNGVFV